MADAAPGDLILVRERNEHGVARVDLVRERHYTAFPWCATHRRWDKRRFRIERARVVAVLPRDADLVALGEELNLLRNRRDARKGNAELDYRARVEALARGAKASAMGF